MLLAASRCLTCRASPGTHKPLLQPLRRCRSLQRRPCAPRAAPPSRAPDGGGGGDFSEWIDLAQDEARAAQAALSAEALGPDGISVAAVERCARAYGAVAAIYAQVSQWQAFIVSGRGQPAAAAPPQCRPWAPRAPDGRDAELAYVEVVAAQGALVAEHAALGVDSVSVATWERCARAYWCMSAVYEDVWQQQASGLSVRRQSTALPPAHSPPSLAGAPRAAGACATPAEADARTAAAEAWAAAAVSFDSMAAGHEAAAEVAEAAADSQPAGARSAAGQEWVRAAEAWGSALEALQAARQADPKGPAVRNAEAAVQAVQRLKSQRRSLRE